MREYRLVAAVNNKRQRLQQPVTMRSTRVLVGIKVLILTKTIYILSKTVTYKCPSRAVMYNRGLIEGSALQTHKEI